MYRSSLDAPVVQWPEAKAEKDGADEAKQEKAKTARSRAKAALEYAGALLKIAARFIVKIKPKRRE